MGPSSNRGTRRRLRRALTSLRRLAPWLRALGCFVVLVVGLLAPAQAQARELVQVPVTVHIATKAGRSVVSEQHVRASISRANIELAEYDIELVVTQIIPMPGGSQLETQDQRFEFGRQAERDGSIHVFFVERVKLNNARKGDRRVSGMHWRYHGLERDIRGREYLAVAHNAPATTLVHEVGHAFGLAHDKSKDNLMCSCRRDTVSEFTERQGRRLRLGAKRFLRRANAS
jgi:hypothetical protein